MGTEELGTLNLADADLSAGDFSPIPGGNYTCHVHEVTAVEVGADSKGKLPAGTPGYNIQFRVDEGPHSNRVLWKRYYIPPTDYDAEKRKTSLGMFVNFLLALGIYTKEQVMSGDFQSDPTDWIGQQVKCSVKLKAAQTNDDGEEIYPAGNEITSVKPLVSGKSEAAAGVL